MDYDDNDFQGQNLHLAGEGSTKFPPALRPYALSKFDFDESLQGHLRFDSLVETEVFLGIESNEDNQWIDAYSRGSSGIEFSSSAAESCSISRHNNVWSEATSSESVEMLLKSVGQEEFIPRQTVIEESNNCDELACLAKAMEPNTKSDDKYTPTGGVADLQPSDRIHENMSGFKEEDADRGQSQAGFSEVHEGEVSIRGSMCDSELNGICPNAELPVPEGGCLIDGKSSHSNKREVEIVAEESLCDKIVDDLSASGMQTCITASSMQNISSTYDVLNIQNVKNQVIGIDDGQQGALPMQIDEQDMGSSILNKDSDIDNQNLKGNAVGGDVHCFDKPYCSDSKKEALEGGSVVDSHHTGVINLEESSDLEKTKRHCEVTCFRNLSKDNAGEDAILHKDSMMDDQSSLNTCDLPNVAIRGDSCSKGQVVEIGNSISSISPNLKQNVNTIEAKTYGESNVTKEKDLLSIGHQMDKEIIISKSEEHMSTMDDNNSPKISEGNCDSKVGGFYGLSMASSPAKSCILGESTEISGSNEVDRQGDHETCHQDVAKNEKESIKVHSYASQMNSEVDGSHLTNKGVGSSSHGAGTSDTELPTSTTLVDDVGANESVSQVISANTSLMSCETMDVSLLKNGVSTDEATDHNDVHKRTHVGSVSINEKQHPAAKTVKDAGISALVGSSELESAPCPLPGTENQQSSDAFRQETVIRCLQVVGTSNVKISEPQETPGDQVIQDRTQTIGFSPVVCESVKKKDDEVTVSFDKHDKETVREDYEKPPSKVSGDALLSNEGSVSVTPMLDSHVELHEIGGCAANHGDISCSASPAIASLSQTEKDGNEVQGSADQNAPVSEFTDRDATTVLSVAHDPKGKNEAKGEISMTCGVNPVADLSINDVTDLTAIDVDKRQSVPATVVSKSLTVVEGSPSTSGLGPRKTKVAGDVSRGSPKVSDGNIARGSKGTPERKTRRASQKTAGKESNRKRNNVKEATPVKQSERGDKSSHVSLSPPPGFQLMQTNEVQQYGRIDCSSTKQFALLNASTSSLPDLNTSAPPVMFQHQPFTDIQQVQLRAQIFVYGALIQGTAPDEAYLISAFGGPDGGRSMWEKAWHACMERQHGQKAQPINQETPQQSRSGSRPSDSAVKQSALQGKGISSPLGRANSKATPTIVNSPMPLSSPLWNVPTPSCDSLPSSALPRGPVVDYPQAFASLHPYQTPPLRNFLGHNTPWVSQSLLRGQWIASPTPVPDNGSHLSASPVSDTIKLNSVKGSSLPPPSGVKNATPGLPASNGGAPSFIVGTTSLLDTNNVTPSSTRHSSDPKPKKRKKATVPEDLGHKALQLQSQLEATPAVSSHVSTSVAITTPAVHVSKTTIDKSIVSASPLSPASQLKNDRNVEKRILSDESLAKVKEARVHAEEAAALSAASVSHSLEIWNQLDKQKNSGLVPDIEAKLASAAVAIAAAAAVAKAAAAAANVASNAALQAKMMADEALASSGYDKSCQSNGISLSINLGKATPASILKGDNIANSSSSIMLAAKEAVRRKVEAASAATQRAENMDAIVKAAELAAEAVSQAGKIVTMGDHLPLSDLVEAGPEGYWKATHESSQQVELLKDMTRGLVNIENVGDNPGSSYKHNRDVASDKIQEHATAREKPTLDILNETSENHMRSRDDVSSSMTINERYSRGPPNGQKVSNLVNPVDMVPETEMQPASVTIRNGSEMLRDNNIKEGSLVEIFKDGEEFKAAWFTANVLSLNDNKAYVCYNVLLADEGAGPLKEWVSLEGEEDKAPRIRMARLLTGLNYEGTRKRRRAAMGDYAWSVGNRVDAWIQESWREGVVTEKNKKDETAFTVHFPAHGETSVVRAWQLRPSLAWKYGKWIDSNSLGANDSSTLEGDTPHEKRPRFNSPAVEARGKDKMSKSSNAIETVNPDKLRLLDLTENDKVFNIGKNNKNENKSDAQRMPRTGLQKEGSRVIFGVPKPGKKRKFMEVSKHYVADKGNKINDGNDSVKLANFLVPRGLGTHGWKNSPKNDGKEKRGADSKPKTSKSGKPQNVLGRTITQKDNPFANTFSLPNNRTDRAEKTKDSASHSKNASESESQMETTSYSESDGAAEGPTLYSSLATSTDASSKKTSTSRASKGKLAPAGGKLGKIEEEKTSNGNSMKPTSEVIEPRRSNRRIQPTSRLLEGLQSSLIISKIPSVSHDKGHKNQNRNASRGNNQG